jgi:hypothetical protein
MQDEVRVKVMREASQFSSIRQAAQSASPNVAEPNNASPSKRNPMVDFGKGAIGFVIGVSGSIGVLCLFFALIAGSDIQSVPAPSVMRFSSFLVLMAGIGTARLFQRQDFLTHFDRLSFGMKRRLPLAIYASWFLLWIGYLIACKSDFGEWYDANTQKFWLMLIVPPTVGLVTLILFRWAHHEQKPQLK